MSPFETLKAELVALDLWDTWYWRSKNPERAETIAYLQRRTRRAEIIEEIVRVKASSRFGEVPLADDLPPRTLR
jgi:hypothetical protein